MNLKQLQSSLTHWVLDPDAKAAPEGVGRIADLPASAGAKLYRDSILEVEIRALKLTFPIVFDLVGESFFRAASKRFLRAGPPPKNAGNLDKLGDTFPAFLETTDGTETTPYLADVARLELAIQNAQDGPDAAPLDDKTTAALSADPSTLTLRLCPNATLLESPYPIDKIREAYLDGFKQQLDISSATTTTRIIVVRTDEKAEVTRLTDDQWILLRAIETESNFLKAIERATSEKADIDVATALASAIPNRWIEPVLDEA